jgi:hypothetical protein
MKKHCKSALADDFNEILLEVTEEACSCLGETAKTAIYAHLRKQYGLEV